MPKPVEFKTMCPPQPHSNDEWTPEVVAELTDRLNGQVGAPENRAAVVIGSGGLPYLTKLLRAAVIFQVNPNGQTVFSWARQQKARFGVCESWDEYHEHALLERRGPRLHKDWDAYDVEQSFAEKSGLQGDYEDTRYAAQNTELEHFDGDILSVAPAIAARARDRGLAICAMNFTNVACWVKPRPNGNSGSRAEGVDLILEHVLGVIPLDPQAVIIDSSRSGQRGELTPELYTPETYHTAKNPY